MMGRDNLVQAILDLLTSAEDRILVVIYSMLLRCAG